MRAALYLVPVAAWLFVTLLFEPKSANEFAFAGSWLLVPLALSYVIWAPLVEFGLGLFNTKAKRDENADAEAENVVHSVLAAIRVGAQSRSDCPVCKARILVSATRSQPALVQLTCDCGACSGRYSVTRASS